MSRSLKPYALVFLLTLCAGSTSTSLAQVIESVTVGKSIEFVQTSPVAVQINPAPPSQTFGGPYGFSADVDGQNISSITAPRVSGPISVPEPFNNGGTLLYNSTEGGWRYGFPNGNDWGVQSLGELNSLFGSGVYTMTVNGTSVALNLTGDAYPNNPVLTLSGGVWSNGKYVIDVRQSLVITTNAFSAYGTHPDDLIGIGVDGVADASQFHSVRRRRTLLASRCPLSLSSAARSIAAAPFLLRWWT